MSCLMQDEQKVVAGWMRRVMDAKGWKAADWARAAGIKADTTISRALKDDYGSVTSIPTLHKLAQAADLPSVLDFLEGDQAASGETVVPSEENLAALLAAIVPLARTGQQTEQSLRVLAAALRHGLELLGPSAATPLDQGSLSVAARAAVARLRDLQQ